MGNIISRLTEMVPTGVEDVLKMTQNTSITSRVSAFLSTAKSYLRNSEILNETLTQVFTYDPSYINDTVVDASFDVPTGTNLTGFGRVNDLEAFELFHNLFDKISKVVYEYGYTRDVVTLTDSQGLVYRIARSAGSHSSAFFIDRGLHYIPDEDQLMWKQADHTTSPVSYRIAVNNVITSLSGEKRSLWDLIYDLQENYALTSSLHDLSTACIKATNDASSITNCIASWANSSWKSVRDLVPQVLKAWSNGGVYGVVSIIINYFKTVESIEPDSDGSLKFSDNASLVPQVYLSGIVSTVSMVLTTIAQAIIAPIARVFTIIGATAVGLVSQMMQALDYRYDQQTLASLVESLQTGYPCSPHGLSQDTQSISGATKTKLGCCPNNGTWAVFVPGGEIIFTCSEQGGVKSEFHPDLVDRRELVYSLCSLHEEDEYGDPDFKDSRQITVAPERDFLDMVDNFEYTGQQVIMANDASGLLSESDSNALASILISNVCLFLMWQFWITNGDFTIRAFTKTIGPGTPTIRERTLAIQTTAGWDNLNNYLTCPQLAGTENSQEDYYLRTLHDVICHVVHGATGSTLWWNANPWTTLSNIAVYSSSAHLISTTMQPYGTVNFIFKPDFNSLLAFDNFFGSMYQLPYQYVWAVKTPKYDRSTYIASIVGSLVIGTIVVAGIAVGSFFVNKAIAAKRSQLKLQAERAWDIAKGNPTAENVTAYKKAAAKHNFFCSLLGGDKINKYDYWGSSSSSSTGETVVSSLGQAVSSSYPTTNYENNDEVVARTTDESDDIRALINRLIVGTKAV